MSTDFALVIVLLASTLGGFAIIVTNRFFDMKEHEIDNMIRKDKELMKMIEDNPHAHEYGWKTTTITYYGEPKEAAKKKKCNKHPGRTKSRPLRARRKA